MDIIKEIISSNYRTRKEKCSYAYFGNDDYDVSEEIYSETEFDGGISTEEQIISVLGRKFKKHINDLGAFLDIYGYIFPLKKLRAVPLPQTGKTLTSLFGDQKNVCNFIKMAKNINLIKCVDENIVYGKNDKSLNKAKKYIMNKNIKYILKEMVKKYKADKVKSNKFYTSNINSSNIRKKNLAKLEQERICIGSNFCINLGDVSSEEIISFLTKKYKQLGDYRKISEKINDKFYADNYKMKIRFNINLKYSANGFILRKIGLRATNSLCVLKAHDINENDENTRFDFLNNYFGKENYVEFDVKSSIYRINHFLNSGKWLSQDVDIYEMMYGRKFDSPQEREEYKAMAMKLYFTKSEAITAEAIVKKDPNLIRHLEKRIIVLSIKEMRRRMVNAIGKTYDSEIFLHESCIYMDLLNYLLGKGLKIFQVYDGFYADKSQISQEELEKICCEKLPEIAKAYFTKYIDKIGKN